MISSIHYIQLEAKKIVVKQNPAYTWWSLADSHTSLIGDKIFLNGVNSASIRGGRVSHIRMFLEKHGFFKGKMSHVFLTCGGNDLDGGVPARVANELLDLIYEIRKFDKNCTVITGTIISRRGTYDNEDAYIKKVYELDTQMVQTMGHHHFLTDVWVDDCDRNGPAKLRKELYIYDGIHLNPAGREILLDVFMFLIGSANRGDYSNRKYWNYKGSTRSIFWKF